MYQSNKKQMGDEQTQADYIICYLKKSMGQWENQIGNQKIPQDKEKCKHNIITLRECSKRSSKRAVHSDMGLPWEMRKTSNKPSNSLLKRIRIIASIPPPYKKKKKNPVSKGKEIIKVRGETNKIEIKKIERSITSIAFFF